MKQITNSEDLKTIQMDILSYIDVVCKKYNIKYSISGGTLIGAIRHKGFIPWDDDIDIMLTRSDYDHLVNAMINEYDKGNVKYRLVTHDIDREFLYPYAKVFDEDTLLIEDIKEIKNFGVYVDVFPIDYISQSSKNKIISRMRFLYNMLTLKRLVWDKERPFLKNLTILFSHVILFPFTCHWIIDKMDKYARKSNNKVSKEMACLVWGYGEREVLPSSLHDNHIYLPFENREYMSIRDYDIYLRNIYGDYMQLPPKEKQITHHGFVAYWKNR